MNNQIKTVIEFLDLFPSMYKTKKKKNIPDPTTSEGKSVIQEIMEDALSKIIVPTVPATIPDPVVSTILEIFHGINFDRLGDIAKEHQLSMGAENVVGALLEDYINSESRHYGWCVCAGEVVHGTDFLRKIDNNNWELLQVKNRDNSENSSSATVRELIRQNSGIVIKKWHRTKSKTGKTNWENFPDDNLKNILNEDCFQNYVKEYLRNNN